MVSIEAAAWQNETNKYLRPTLRSAPQSVERVRVKHSSNVMSSVNARTDRRTGPDGHVSRFASARAPV